MILLLIAIGNLLWLFKPAMQLAMNLVILLENLSWTKINIFTPFRVLQVAQGQWIKCVKLRDNEYDKDTLAIRCNHAAWKLQYRWECMHRLQYVLSHAHVFCVSQVMFHRHLSYPLISEVVIIHMLTHWNRHFKKLKFI